MKIFLSKLLLAGVCLFSLFILSGNVCAEPLTGYLDSANPDDNPWKREGINRALRAAGLPELTGRVAGSRYNFVDVASDDLAETLHVHSPTAVLSIEEVGYNEENEPILKAYSYFRDDLLRLGIIRRKV